MENETRTFCKLSEKSRKYSDVRSREYLLPDEVDTLIKTARSNRTGLRDSTFVLLSFRHGLRLSEALNLKWSDIDFAGNGIHINRAKSGISNRHPLRSIEVIALNKLYKARNYIAQYIFTKTDGMPICKAGMQKMFSLLGEKANMPFPIHHHMLRHSCGYFLANKGIDTRAIAEYLGHTNLKHTYRYTAISPKRFNDFWAD